MAEAASVPLMVDLNFRYLAVTRELVRLLDTFVATVAHGKPLECSGRDHLRSLAMVQACITSSLEGRSARLSEISDTILEFA